MSTELLVQQIGKFHLVVLHFPVALLLLTPLVMAASLLKGQDWWRKAVPYFVHLGAIATIGTTILGLLLAVKLGKLDGALSQHRTMGIVTSVLISFASAYLLIAKPDLQKKLPVVLWILVLASAACVGLTGHLGGEHVHGPLIILGGSSDAGEL